MIRIHVVSRQGSPMEQPPSAQFGPDGGTIGRQASNTLVLDDSDRTVSRVHAQVRCREGRFFIIDQGSNPLQFNGQALGAGREALLHEGDVLGIGNFELLVSIDETGQEAAEAALNTPMPPPDDDDPFAHLLDGLVAPAGGSPAKVAGAPGPDPTAGLFPDPLSEGESSPAATDPFADLLTPPAGASVARSAAAAAPSRPDDFSDLVTPSSAGSESIDALFGLGGPLAHDPLAMTPLDDPLSQPNTASAADPLAALARPVAPRKTARGDHLPVDEFAFVAPVARIPVPAPPPPSAVSTPAVIGPDIAPPDAPVDRFQATLGPSRAEPKAHPAAAMPAPAPAPAVAVHAPPQGEQAAGDALLAALLRGLGPMQSTPELLTPGLMERLGELLRTSTEGTLQLLHTRQEFKHEVRAQVTVIAAQANNPLKFSPTVEVALAHLLGPGMRGFMPAEAAMRDAYQDLRAHEFGVMVGMRAALEHVIKQFAPEALEQNITAKSRLDAIFTANRKARLWDQFVKLYADIAREAEDDFHTLFGKAFLKAYQEQLDRLAGGAGPASKAGR